MGIFNLPWMKESSGVLIIMIHVAPSVKIKTSACLNVFIYSLECLVFSEILSFLFLFFSKRELLMKVCLTDLLLLPSLMPVIFAKESERIPVQEMNLGINAVPLRGISFL